MAEKDTPTTHTEPMTTEMMAAVDANSSSDEKPAKKSVPRKKAAVKKRAAPKKKSSTKKKAAPKKKAAVKKKAAPKKKVAPKKKSAVKKKSAPKKSSATNTSATAAVAVAATATKQSSDPVDNKPEPQPAAKVAKKVEAPTPGAATLTETAVEEASKAAATAGLNSEEKQRQQQIRQKLVDLGVADAAEIGAVAHEEPQASSRPFWIKAMIALLVIVGLYIYSKGSNDISTTQITSQPVVTPLESHSHGEALPEKRPISEIEGAEASPSEPAPPEALATQSVNVTEEDTKVTAAQDSDTQPEKLTMQAVGDADSEESLSESVLPESRATEADVTATQGSHAQTANLTTQTAENSDSDENVAAVAPASEAAETTEQIQHQYIPGYIYPNPWNPNYYPPFNAMNQVAPINPYNYPPINMAPGMVPPPYYNYPPAPYQSPQFAPIE